MLDNNLGARPFEVVPDGDLLCLIHHMLLLRGPDTVKVTKVKGHASEDMVVGGRVRDLDRLGNNAADKAADFGRRRFPVRVIDARRDLVGVCSRWYPVVSHLHRFFVAIARAVVNHDDGGGTAPNPLVWSAGSLPKRRRVIDAVRDFAFLPGPVGIWDGDRVSSAVSCITVEDVRVWPYSVFFLLRCWPFWALCIGRLVLLILVLEVFLLLKCSFCLSCGLVRDFVLRVLFLSVGGLDVQFQYRVFLLVQALIFGALVVLFVL